MSISQSIAEKTVDNCFISELRNDGHGQHYMSRPLSGGDITTKNTTLWNNSKMKVERGKIDTTQHINT